MNNKRKKKKKKIKNKTNHFQLSISKPRKGQIVHLMISRQMNLKMVIFIFQINRGSKLQMMKIIIVVHGRRGSLKANFKCNDHELSTPAIIILMTVDENSASKKLICNLQIEDKVQLRQEEGHGQ